MANKPTFADLYIQNLFIPQQLVVQANVPMDVLDRLLLDQPVSRETAEQVIAALSRLTRRSYSLENVRVVIHESC